MHRNKHPQGFSIFFLTEMWERYGFYVLQSLLVFYALERLQMGDSVTYAMVGSFTALAYINSIFGGMIADNFIGYDKAVLTGAGLLSLGYLLLTLAANKHLDIPLLQHYLNNTHVFFLTLGLAIITVGTGMLKPNISSMLSMLYTSRPEQKEVGYTLFYVGIYFGAISGSFIGGYIKQYFGWGAVFASAVVGLMIAFVTFYLGRKKYGLYDNRNIVRSPQNVLKAIIIILVLIIIGFFGIHNESLATKLFSLIGILSAVYLVVNIVKHQGIERKRLIAFAVLILFSVCYWAIYFQQFFSISLCTARVTSLSLPESSFTAFESLGVILFGPLINLFWLWLQKRNSDWSITAKFSASFLFNAISFLILIFGLQYAIAHNVLQNQIFIILAYLIIALGELFIAPTGLAMVSTLVPQRLNGAMMGLNLMSIGFGGKLAGLFAQAAVNENTHASISVLEELYKGSFTYYFYFSLATFIVCVLAIKPLNRLIQGK